MRSFDYRASNIDKLRRLLRSRRPSERKLRLFMVACCQLDRTAITYSDGLALVALAEHQADAEVTADELAKARKIVHRWCRKQPAITGPWPERDKRWVGLWGPYQSATDTPTKPPYGFLNDPDYRPVLADILGPPSKSVAFPPAWRTDTVVPLARTMYESRDFSAMPILADALEDAGCDHADILDHCRDTALAHVRGCWVVDLVLGKE